MLAQRLPVPYPEGAFVAGLLHDVGRLLIAVGLPEEHDRILDNHSRGNRPVSESELNVLGFTHSDLSAQALAFWNLPEPIQLAARDHHISQGGPGASGDLSLSRVVGAADQYVHSIGVSILPQRITRMGADVAAIERLGMDSPNGVTVE
jgi:HD-like signal output (HDOD) protein